MESEEDNKYLEDMFALVYSDILEYLEIIRLTESEIKSLPYFSRSKVKKEFTQSTGLSVDDMNREFLEIRNFLYTIERDIKVKNFIKLEEKLRTYAYKYIPLIDKLIPLSKFYSSVPEQFKRANKKRGDFTDIDGEYEKRRSRIIHLHENLTGIYRVIAVE